AVVGHKQQMRLVAAGFLVEKLAPFGEIHGLTPGDVFQKDNGIGNTAIGRDDQALKIAFLLALRITDLRVFVYENRGNLGDRPGPFHRTGDGAAIVDGNRLIARLGGAAHRSQNEYENHQKNRFRLHSAPLRESMGGRPVKLRVSRRPLFPAMAATVVFWLNTSHPGPRRDTPLTTSLLPLR